MTKFPHAFAAAASVLLYSPALFYSWVYLDDYLIVQRAAYFSKLSNIPAAFLAPVWAASGNEYNFYRPVSTSFYIAGGWISHQLTNEILPWPFHLTNLFLVGAATALLVTLFRTLGASNKAALIATLFLIAHPLTVGSAVWIPGQNELLLAIFSLGAILAYVYSLGNRRWLAAHAALLLLALLTKENAIAVPALCFVYLCLVARTRSLRVWAWSLFTWGATTLSWYLLIRQGGGEQGPAAGRALEALWHGFPLLAIYLGQLVLPFSLGTLPVAVDTGWWIWGAGGLVALVLTGAAVWRCKTKPLILFGVLWFVGFLLPTFANLVPAQKEIYILRADRSFLAMAGVAIALLQFRFRFNVQQWQRLNPALIKTGAAAALFILIALNVVHQFNYADAASFYGRGVEGSPHSPFAHTHLGDVFLAKNDLSSAIAHYQEALRLNPGERQVHNNLGVALLRLGRVDEAEAEFVKDIANTPNSLLAWPNLGTIYLNRGEYDKAEEAFRRSVVINPAFRDGWAGLVRVYTVTRDEARRREAESMLDRAEMDFKSGL